MPITRTVTQSFAGPTAAGQILAPTINVGLGVPAAMAGVFEVSGVFGGDSMGNTTAYCGYRVAQPMDLSAHRYIGFLAANNDLNRFALHNWADGGIRIVFQDAAGNWTAYRFFSSGLADDWGVAAEGSFQGWMGFPVVNSRGQMQPAWAIERSRTPDASSGILNWAAIVAHEVHFRPRHAGRMHTAVGRFMTFDVPRHTGAVSGAGFFVDIAQAYGAPGIGDFPLLWMSRPIAPFASAAAQPTQTLWLGVDIGDGVTPTTLALVNTAIVLWPRPEDLGAVAVPNTTVLIHTPRLLRFRTSPTDTVTLTDVSISTRSMWGVEVAGSAAATCTFTRCQFWRYNHFEVAHGQFPDCQFNDGTTPIVVGGPTVVLDGVIQRATTSALRINTGPAVYGGLRLRMDNPTAVADIELGSAGAGTYDLRHISVPAGYTLKIRNNSLTNAVVVTIAAGIAVQTTTAGGAITVQRPVVMATGQITNIVAGSRVQVFNETLGTEVFNAIVSGATYTSTYADGTTFRVGDVVRVRLAWQLGATARVPVQYRTVATAAGWSILADQQLDVVYNRNAVNGDQVTEFVADMLNVRINVNDPDGVTSVQRGYAWYIAGQMSAGGIAVFHGGMTAEDVINYRINVGTVNMHIQNVRPTPVMVIGGRLYRSDGSPAAVAGGGGILMEPGRAYAVETGVSGLTAQESARLLSLASAPAPEQVAAAVLAAAQTAPIHADMRRVRGQVLAGAGTEADPWRP